MEMVSHLRRRWGRGLNCPDWSCLVPSELPRQERRDLACELLIQPRVLKLSETLSVWILARNVGADGVTLDIGPHRYLRMGVPDGRVLELYPRYCHVLWVPGPESFVRLVPDAVWGRADALSFSSVLERLQAGRDRYLEEQPQRRSRRGKDRLWAPVPPVITNPGGEDLWRPLPAGRYRLRAGLEFFGGPRLLRILEERGAPAWMGELLSDPPWGGDLLSEEREIEVLPDAEASPQQPGATASPASTR